MRKYNTNIGDRYNKWTVIGNEISHRTLVGKLVRRIPCKCNCGKESNVEIWKLVKGKIKECNHCNKLGHIPWNKNKKGVMPTPWNKDKKWPEFTGKNHPRWVKDRTMLQMYGDDNKDRRCSAAQAWRREVIKRDCNKCKMDNLDCKDRLEVHHILGWKEYPELRYQVNNGITLCHAHHPRKRDEVAKLSPYFKQLVAGMQ